MDKEYELTLKHAIDEETKGNIDSAILLYNQALKESGEDAGVVLFEVGDFMFSQGRYAEALEAFVKCHQLGFKTHEIEQFIMSSYYEPNIDEFRSKYEKNTEALSKYEHIYSREFSQFSQLDYRFLPYSETKFEVFDMKESKFIGNFDMEVIGYNVERYKSREILMIKNEVNSFSIMECVKATEDMSPYLWEKVPLYLFFDDFNYFIEFLQISDFTKIIDTKRLIFLFGLSQLETWFDSMQSILPNYVLNIQDENDYLYQKVNKISSDREILNQTLKEEVDSYYSECNFNEIINAFIQGRPRIMFITTKFSTAIQYFTRDCVEACNKLGIPNKLCIEISDVHRSAQNDWIKTIAEFKPHAIFIIDHFRWEYSLLPHNIVFISWIHDLLPHILSNDSARKIKDKDFILNLIPNYKGFKEARYPKEQIIDTPIPVNPDIYKSYKLTREEIDRFETEICVISNPGNPLEGLKQMLHQFKEQDYYENLETALKCAYDECYKLIYSGHPIFDSEQIDEMISRWLDECGMTYSNGFITAISDMFKTKVVWIIYRSVPIEWLKEKGYRIKLWGKEWMGHKNLKEYAMGVAENGEQLSKILNSSKILIGTNPAISAHPRVFEAIMSNCLYIGINIPTEYDSFNIRGLMDEDQEIVLFYSKDDLYKKVDYYLKNEEERLRVIANGKNKILSKITYEKMMTNSIEIIGNKLRKGNLKKVIFD